MEEDEFGNICFVGMQRVPLMFDDRPLFSELFGSARDELHYNSNEDVITIVNQTVFLGGWSQLHQRHNRTNISKLS